MTTLYLTSRWIHASFLKDVLQIIGASLLLAVSAQIGIRDFFSPVPFTLQTLAVMWIGGTLGATKGALAVLAYLMEGSLGLPFFAEGWCGFATLFSARGGYLIGFLFQACFMGWWVANRSSMYSLFGGALFSSAITLSFGVLWLSFSDGQAALLLGLYPFIPGEVIKSLIAAKCFAK